jgi:hypothetical protein
MKINKHLIEVIDSNLLSEVDTSVIDNIIDSLGKSGVKDALYNPITWIEIAKVTNKDALTISLEYIKQLKIK